MIVRRALGLWGVLLALLPTLGAQPARADDDAVSYGPVPEGIAAVVPTETERALANSAITVLCSPPFRDGFEWSRKLLVLLDDVGLQAVATRLARGGVPRSALPILLQIVSVSDHEEADLLLLRAAKERRPVLRMIAAEGLGRGRTIDAVGALETLARDDVSGVRAAALRSLFASEAAEAVTARCELPTDRESSLHAYRLRSHLRTGDRGAAVLALARDGYLHGRTAAVRSEASHLLAQPGVGADPKTLRLLILENGSGDFIAGLRRWALGAPQYGYDSVHLRRIAIDAALTLYEHADATDEDRTWALERMVDWIARPVDMDPYLDTAIPEHKLRLRLPDFGAPIIEPVLTRLKAGAFFYPRHGIVLIRELGPELALPVLHELIAPGDAETEAARAKLPFRQRFLRLEASEVLSRWKRVGDEGLARKILASDAPVYLKLDIVNALVGEPASWALPLLRETLHAEAVELRLRAIDVLERRPEPEARAILIEDLFREGTDAYQRADLRLAPVVGEPIDDLGWTLLERALAEPRWPLQRAALAIVADPRRRDVRTERTQALLEAVAPRFDQAREALLIAWVVTDPQRAVRYVREVWEQADHPRSQEAWLRQLKDVRGEAAVNAAVDFALSIAATLDKEPRFLGPVTDVLEGRWRHRGDEITAFWRRLLAPNARKSWLTAVASLDHPGAPDLADLLLPILVLARNGKALADSTENDEVGLAQDVLRALRFQPWDKIESAVVETTLDPLVQIGVRLVAARMLIGRVRPKARSRLAAWLYGTSVQGAPANPAAETPEGWNQDGMLQWLVAGAVGVEGDAAAAKALLGALQSELQTYYGVTANLDPDSAPTKPFVHRAGALAYGVMRTKSKASIEALGALLFLPQMATYATKAADRQRSMLFAGGVGSAARAPAPLPYLEHTAEGLYHVLTPEASRILAQLRTADDETLSDVLGKVLESAHKSSSLALFPDVYLFKIALVLRDERDGARPRAAETVERYIRRLAPVDGIADYASASRRADVFARAGRYTDAVRAQETVVRIIARRNYEEAKYDLRTYARAKLDALRGQVHAADGEDALAEAAFRRAILRAPGDAFVLRTVALLRARVDFNLALAEDAARRAVHLEQRVRDEPRVETLDPLAYVLLKRDRPQEALMLLRRPLLLAPDQHDADPFLHLAQAYAALNRLTPAARALEEALVRAPHLEAEVRADPYFEPLDERGWLDIVVRRAKRRTQGE